MPKRIKHIPYRILRTQFTLLSLFSVACVFTIALLSRAELRLSGEVLGAGDGNDLKRLFELRDCTAVDLVRETPELRLHIVSCDPYDYLVESKIQEGAWEVVSVEKMRE